MLGACSGAHRPTDLVERAARGRRRFDDFADRSGRVLKEAADAVEGARDDVRLLGGCGRLLSGGRGRDERLFGVGGRFLGGRGSAREGRGGEAEEERGGVSALQDHAHPSTDRMSFLRGAVLRADWG